MTKGIFLDLNGTLLNDKDELNQEDIKFIKSLKENVYIITGLPFKKAKVFYDKLGLNTYLTSSGGQQIYKDGKFIHSEYLNVETVNKITSNINNYYVESDDSLTEVGNNDFKIGQSSNDEFDSNKVLSIYSRDKVDNLHAREWELNDGSIIYIYRSENISKLKSLKLIEELDSLEHTIYLGDGRVDIDSINYVDEGYAMKNSQSEVIQKTSKVTKFTNHEHGVVKQLKEII